MGGHQIFVNECIHIILACDNTQVLLVTGGRSYNLHELSSTEVSLSSCKTLYWWNRKTISFCTFKSQFHICLLIRKIKRKAVTTRWPSTQVAANWNGGRWRADSFLHQGLDHKFLWSTISSLSPAAGKDQVTTSSPRSSPGTQWPSLGNLLETLLWGEPTMQPSPFPPHLLNVNLKTINSKH